MCGIAGYFGREIITESQINKCTNSIFHRGPDGNGNFHSRTNDKTIVLIHTRLAIIDLDNRSNQPFRIGNKILIFNGEIYNYLEIKKELQTLGHKFNTSGDTEVLAKSLEQWGTHGLEKLEGMWSFALYDEKKQELLLCRDRFGEKPLYIWQCNDGIYFGSEIKSIAALSGRWPRINKNHIYRYLINGYKFLHKVSETFYEKVHQVKSGHFIIFSNNDKHREGCYWEKRKDFAVNMTYKDAVEKTKDALIKALKIRLRSDVPIAFCMSGGIDSNTLISIANKIFNCDIHAFTIKNKDERYEETELIDYSVSLQGLNHTYLELENKDFLYNLKKLIDAHDCPVYTISYYLHWQLMGKIAEKGYKVSISGTGADELFSGYYDHHNFYLAEIFNNKELFQYSKNNWEKYVRPIVRNPFLKDPNLFIENPNFRDHILINKDIFLSFCHENWSENFKEKNFRNTILRNRMDNELFEETVPVILHEDDLNAMYFSIENRSPFLDKNLYELSSTIPTKYLIKDGKAKSVLRDSMDGIVPEKILNNRRKVGFNGPILDLLDINNKQIKDKLLDDSPIYEIINKDKVEELLMVKELPNSMSRFLFRLINSKIFIELFEEKN